MLTFQQSEATAERRRWIIVLVDSTDGVTGLTGQTGTVKISKNGAAAANSTNSIVEVDSGDMPGHYYIELTAAELDTLGHISITKKTAGSLAFHDRAIVSYNDPYISAGGFASGGSSFRLTDKHIEAIAKKVWEYQLKENVTAKDQLLQAADHPMMDMTPMMEKMDSIVIPELDISPVMEAVSQINIPEPKDYSKEFAGITKQLADIVKSHKIDVASLAKVAEELRDQMKAGIEQTMAGSIDGVTEIKSGLEDLNELLIELRAKADEMNDMDKRFENMTSLMQKQQLTELTSRVEAMIGEIKTALDDNKKETLEKILIALVDNKFDLLEEINNV